MTIFHKAQNGDGQEVKTISVQAVVAAQALTVTIAIAVIGFLLGGQHRENEINSKLQEMAARVLVIEADNRSRDQRLDNTVQILSDHLAWSGAKTNEVDAHMAKIDTDIALLRQRQEALERAR